MTHREYTDYRTFEDERILRTAHISLRRSIFRTFLLRCNSRAICQLRNKKNDPRRLYSTDMNSNRAAIILAWNAGLRARMTLILCGSACDVRQKQH